MALSLKTFQTLFGVAAVVYSCAPFKIYKLYLPRKTSEMLLDDVHNDFDDLQESHHKQITVFIADFQNYFQGHPVAPPWEWLEWQKLTPLQIETLRKTAEIPFGDVVTYKALATKIGRPRATRFVGSCMARNPFPIIIPCHRVIRSDGTLGNFGGGVHLKEKLLALEQCQSTKDHCNETISN